MSNVRGLWIGFLGLAAIQPAAAAPSGLLRRSFPLRTSRPSSPAASSGPKAPSGSWDGGGYLLFSDVPNNRIYRWSKGTGASVFLDPRGER